MDLLLDTHVFLWWVNDADELAPKWRKAIANPDNRCHLSVVSCWEMAIKSSLGKLTLAQPLERFIPEQLQLNDFRLLDLDFRHICKVESLPFHHRDPFDRLLIAQASVEKMTILTADSEFSRYSIKIIT